MQKLRLSLLIAAGLIASAANAETSTLRNILGSGHVGAAVAAATLPLVYKITSDADLAATGASITALMAMQAKEDLNNKEESVRDKARNIILEGFKPVIGLGVSKTLPYLALALQKLGVPTSLAPEVKLPATLVNLVLLAGISIHKALATVGSKP